MKGFTLLLEGSIAVPVVVRRRLEAVWRAGCRCLEEAAYAKTRCLLVFVSASCFDLDEVPVENSH